MKPCRECQHTVSEQAISCPQCGAPYPAREKWDGWVFAVGQVSIGQFTIAGFALAQFAAAWSLIAQIGLYIHEGHGQLVINILKFLQ